ncbi:MAG: translation initiation factor IF-2 [Acidobacteria bacterium]|nr:translation initiation factor IF-2 [Acidobacteriota bacterium]
MPAAKKVKVSDLAKLMKISAQDLIFKLQSLGVEVDSPESALGAAEIEALRSGKKLTTRAKSVIMREEAPVAEVAPKQKVVKPPRPIVQPARKGGAVPVQPKEEAPPLQGPVIQEFVEAAEAEAAEQARAAVEPPKPAPPRRVTPPRPIVAPRPPVVPEEPAEQGEVASDAPAAPVVEPVAPASPLPAAATPSAPAAAATHGHGHAHGHAPAGRRVVTGPTGPRARRETAPRPNYQGSTLQPLPVRPPAGAARPAAPGQTARPTGTRPAVSRPGGAPPRPGTPGAVPPAPGTIGPLGLRRRRDEGDEERPDKKKTTGKRGRRAPNVADEDARIFTKGPFSATAVLDEDGVEITPAKSTGGEEAPVRKHAPSSRRDARKQQSPRGDKALEFQRPEGKLTVSEGVTVKDLADKIGVKANDLMKHLMLKRGMMLSINAPLGAELAQQVARELGVELELVSFEEAFELETMEKFAAKSDSAAAQGRGPVITVMGHVDHGKTSLLDAIRETKVAEGEAGGITQHIGAYQIEKRGKKIVFLDTPGHEAFTMMRARGAQATDIVVLVVAADDGVMPQTKEAISHAKAAGVPMIVAINKVDKPNANVEKVRRELSEAGVLVEQWGGEIVSVEVSAKQRKGIDDLLEMILLTAEMLDLKATPELSARGVVLEAKKDPGRGIMATILVQDGSLKIGDYFISGPASGRVRAMTDDRGDRVKEAGPATPVSVTGFDDIPNAGDTFLVVDEAAQARVIGEMRQAKVREAALTKAPKMSLDQLFEKMQEGSLKELNVIIKGDVQGSVEVLNDAVSKLSNNQVRIRILYSSVGAISTNDVLLASASEAIVIGFNVRPQRDAQELAEKEGVDLRLHTVIYELLDEMKQAMTGLLEPTLKEAFQGRAEVRDTFKVPKAGTIAGCYVREGIIPRTANIRLLRDNRVIFEGKIASLRHFKNDVSEVKEGFECGIGLERFQDLKVGDVIEAFKIEKLAGVLQS